MIALFYDERIKGVRYIIFMLVLMFHIVVLKEGWYETEMLIIQDLFWYSLIMMSSFVWHVLIMNWLYKLCEYIKWDYGCYVISRWSLLTSLTIILWIILWFEKIILDYKIHQFSIKDNKICEWQDINYLIKAMFILLKWIIEYFSMSFQNYSKILLGLSIKINIFKMPIKFYIYFIFTLFLSFFLMIPRIYIVWELLVIWKISVLIKKIWQDWIKWNRVDYLKGECTLFSCFSERIWIEFYEDRWDKRYIDSEVSISNKNFRNLLTDDWILIYPEGLINEFIFYTKLPSWEQDPRHLETFIENINDILKIFEYSQDRYKKLLVRMLESYLLNSDIEWNYHGTIENFNISFLEEKDYLKEEDLLGNYKIDGKIVEWECLGSHRKKSSIDLWMASKIINITSNHFRSVSIMNIIKQDKMIRWISNR